jgi:hypothetical protein
VTSSSRILIIFDTRLHSFPSPCFCYDPLTLLDPCFSCLDFLQVLDIVIPFNPFPSQDGQAIQDTDIPRKDEPASCDVLTEKRKEWYDGENEDGLDKLVVCPVEEKEGERWT